MTDCFIDTSGENIILKGSLVSSTYLSETNKYINENTGCLVLSDIVLFMYMTNVIVKVIVFLQRLRTYIYESPAIDLEYLTKVKLFVCLEQV